ncbi:cell division protein CrgA [Aeromicrobium panaciterrae]
MRIPFRSNRPEYVVARDKAPKAPKPTKIGNRWAGPAMVISAVVGLIWIVVFYTISDGNTEIPFYSDLGQWNLVIGMGFIVAAFGFAMKWE